MLYKIPFFSKHQSIRLNKNICYFFFKIRNVDNNSSIYPLNNYFHPEFELFLQNDKQKALRKLFEEFFNIYKGLKPLERKTIYNSFCKSQNIENIIDTINISDDEISINVLPETIKVKTQELFSYLYKQTLKSFGCLEDHYTHYYTKVPKVCPFCGIEKVHKSFQQDYDHILFQSKYIFCSVNMKNLVPSGVICNRIFKGGKDVINVGGIRTTFYFPFKISENISITLNGSTLPGTIGSNGNWFINISPNNRYTQAWESIFNIKKRYIEDELNANYKIWLDFFKTSLIFSGSLPIDETTLRSELYRFGSILHNHPLEDSNIIRSAFFLYISETTDNSFINNLLRFYNDCYT